MKNCTSSGESWGAWGGIRSGRWSPKWLGEGWVNLLEHSRAAVIMTTQNPAELANPRVRGFHVAGPK